MQLSWQTPWAALVGVMVASAIIVLTKAFACKHDTDNTMQVFSLSADLRTERAAKLLRQWRILSRTAAALMAVALLLTFALIARPMSVDQGEERAGKRDIVLCLDVSGSTLPYDREVINTYRDLVSHFQGERIGMSIFNSTSRTVFPLTDDYELVSHQLDLASKALSGVQSQDDIDKMSEEDYQRISDWLEGTQNRKDTTSLIGDGVISCAAMLPGFTYGSANTTGSTERTRAASIVLATDNVVSGKPVYTLKQALDLTSQAHITVDGLFSGPVESEKDDTTTNMRELIEAHHGTFLTQSGGTSVNELVRDINTRRTKESETASKASMVDDPAWWVLALAVIVTAWLLIVWRLKR